MPTLPREDSRGILQPQAGRARFSLERRPPAPALAAFVDRHWIVRWDLGDAPPYTQTVLPHPCVNLAGEADGVAVHGIPVHHFERTLRGAGQAVGTKFRPGGFAPFVGRPMHAINDRVVPLAGLFGEDGETLDATLTAAHGDPDRHLDAVEAFLIERLPALDPRLALVQATVEAMRLAGPGVTVADLAAHHGISTRTLQRVFRDAVGVGPKWVLGRYRIHDAAERLATGEADDPADLALELGYFDQSHFTRDFTAQVGVAPVAYAKACAAAAGRPVPAG